MSRQLFIYLIVYFGLIFSCTAIQTDTHTYILADKKKGFVLSVDRRTGEQTPVKVGENPKQMLIHGGLGYVVNINSDSLSVIDLLSNSVISTIPVGKWPTQIAIHEGFGYVVNSGSDSVSVIDLKSSKVIQTISVGSSPNTIGTHEGFGYVVNSDSDSVSVINVNSHTLIRTIPVGERPCSIVLHGSFGYVTNWASHSVSVIDLTLQNVVKTIKVGKTPDRFMIYEGLGYVENRNSDTVSVINLISHQVVSEIQNPKSCCIDFSDTHVYLGINKVRPNFPSRSSLSRIKTENRLRDFVAMNPEPFNIGEIEERDYPRDRNQFDLLPPYVLAHHLFWDVDTGKPLMDPVDILATLVIMKYPQNFLQSVPVGLWLRNHLHMAFFQAVWLNDEVKAQKLLRYFIQLKDPVIPRLATYTMVKPPVTVSGTTNSTLK